MTRYDSILRDNTPENALVQLTEIINNDPADTEALYVRGKLYWKLGQRSQATSDYAAASALDPESPAAEALKLARDVENFFNPDLLNP